MANNVTSNTTVVNECEYSNYLSTLVWKDTTGIWRVSQATSKETLLREKISQKGMRIAEYKLFEPKEYKEAIKYINLKNNKLKL